MMRQVVRTVVEKLKRKHGDIEPEELCDELGILLREEPMEICKGFFIKKSRIKLIMLNSEMHDRTKKIMLCHEVGHAVLHANTQSACGFHDAGLFDLASKCEQEANTFAAEYLMRDEDVLDVCECGMSIYEAAKRLSVPPELLNVKCRIMKDAGYPVQIPMYTQNGFMGRIVG